MSLFYSSQSQSCLSDTVRKINYPFVETAYKKYKEDVGSKYIPPFKELEQFRIKRYLTNGNERFDEHVDVTDLILQ